MSKLTTKQKQHVALCAVCNHPQLNEIEEKYLEGMSPYKLESDYPGITAHSLYRHAEVFGLSERREGGTLRKVRKLIDRIDIDRFSIKNPEAMICKLLELEAKLAGELVEKRENKNTNTNKTEIDVSKSIQRRIDRLIDAVPGLRECVGNDEPDPDSTK